MNRNKVLIPAVLAALVLLALIMLLALRSCAKPEAGNGQTKAAVPAQEAAAGSEETEESTAPDITGTYEITAMVTDGEETPSEDLELMKSKGLDCTVTLEADGTGVLDLFGEETDLTWNEEAVSTDEKAWSYSCADGQLILTDGDSSLTFLRTDLP